MINVIKIENPITNNSAGISGQIKNALDKRDVDDSKVINIQFVYVPSIIGIGSLELFIFYRG